MAPTSDISTTISFVDDGASLIDRFPPKPLSNPLVNPRPNVASWFDTAHSEASSAYAGSFVDDGADLVPRRAGGPGFGDRNVMFYEEKRRREARRRKMPEHPAVMRAVSGEINETVRKIRDVGRFRVMPRSREDMATEGRGNGGGMRVGWGRAEERKGGWYGDAGGMGDVVELDEEMKPVRMPVPSGWGTWIIHGDPGGDGRVIVVDSEGVYDSGPIIQPQQHPPPPRQQQQQQPVQKAGKRKGKHVNFQHEDQIKSAAKGNESAHAPEPPQMSAKQLKKLEKASKQAEWKRKQAGEENNGNGVVDDKDQEVVMSGGRGGWPRQPPPRTSPIQPSGPSGWEGEEGLVDNWGPKSVLPDWPGPQFQPMNSPVGRPSSPARRMNSPTDVAKADDDIWAGGGGLGAWPPLMPARPVTSPIMGNQNGWTGGTTGGWQPSMGKPMNSPNINNTGIHNTSLVVNHSNCPPAGSSAPETRFERPRYRNGYDEENGTWLNAERGGVRYRQSPVRSGHGALK